MSSSLQIMRFFGLTIDFSRKSTLISPTHTYFSVLSNPIEFSCLSVICHFSPSVVSSLFVVWVLSFQLDANSLSLRSCLSCLCFPHSIYLTLRRSWFICDHVFSVILYNSENYVINFGKAFINSSSKSFRTKMKWSRIHTVFPWK